MALVLCENHYGFFQYQQQLPEHLYIPVAAYAGVVQLKVQN
jgi:hypothetical protein